MSFESTESTFMELPEPSRDRERIGRLTVGLALAVVLDVVLAAALVITVGHERGWF